jgi:hypothetical protein
MDGNVRKDSKWAGKRNIGIRERRASTWEVGQSVWTRRRMGTHKGKQAERCRSTFSFVHSEINRDSRFSLEIEDLVSSSPSNLKLQIP